MIYTVINTALFKAKYFPFLVCDIPQIVTGGKQNWNASGKEE